MGGCLYIYPILPPRSSLSFIFFSSPLVTFVNSYIEFRIPFAHEIQILLGYFNILSKEYSIFDRASCCLFNLPFSNSAPWVISLFSPLCNTVYPWMVLLSKPRRGLDSRGKGEDVGISNFSSMLSANRLVGRIGHQKRVRLSLF